jgi:hypothetical protein
MSETELRIEYNRAKWQGWIPYFRTSANAHGFTLDFVMAFPSRETNMKDIKGDFRGGDYHGYSLMQVDIGTDPEFCRQWEPNVDVDKSIERGVAILAGKRDELKAHDVTDLHAIAAAYNCGEENVLKAVHAGLDVDSYTTQKNYGADVLKRAAIFKAFIDADSDNV